MRKQEAAVLVSQFAGMRFANLCTAGHRHEASMASMALPQDDDGPEQAPLPGTSPG